MNKFVYHRLMSLIGRLLLAQFLISSCQLSIDNRQSNPVSENTTQLILNMRNEDVIWDGNFAGLTPKTLNGATLALRDSKEPIEPLLLEALLDEDRYVAAHVLLTLRTGGTYSISAESWNGLQVQLTAGEGTTYEGNDLDALYQRWIEGLVE
jgi:hypothetical protein